MNTRNCAVSIAVLSLVLATLSDALFAKSIESGEVVLGSIDSPGATETITFEGSAGDTVVISQAETGGDLKQICELYDPFGISMGDFGFTNNQRTYQLSENGTYSILVDDWYGDHTGTYNVSMIRMVGYPLSTSDKDIGPIAVNATLAGTIAPPSDLDVATFSGQSGDTIVISQAETGGDLKQICELYDPFGISMGDFGFTNNQKTYQLSENGTYSILIYDWYGNHTGSYQISTQIVAGPSLADVPDDPTGLEASDGTYEDYILVSWNASSQATGYDIWRKEGEGDYSQIYKDSSATDYQDYGVQSGKVYTYKVRSRNSYAVSAFSTPDEGRLPGSVLNDFNGDGTSDIAIFREGSGLWAIRQISRIYFGGSGDSPEPGDYDADGTTDVGIFRGTSGLWAVRGVTRVYFGSSSDYPVPGDYDGNGTCDVGIYRESSGLWAIRGVTRSYFGGSGDEPVPGYYAGDGSKNIGIFRPGSGLWALKGVSRVYFGGSGDEPVAGDYDGDGAWEVGIYRSTSGLWAIREVTRAYFGSGSDLPVPADYDGRGEDDIGIFRGTSGLWAVRGVTRVYFGSGSDIPVTR